MKFIEKSQSDDGVLTVRPVQKNGIDIGLPREIWEETAKYALDNRIHVRLVANPTSLLMRKVETFDARYPLLSCVRRMFARLALRLMATAEMPPSGEERFEIEMPTYISFQGGCDSSVPRQAVLWKEVEEAQKAYERTCNTAACVVGWGLLWGILKPVFPDTPPKTPIFTVVQSLLLNRPCEDVPRFSGDDFPFRSWNAFEFLFDSRWSALAHRVGEQEERRQAARRLAMFLTLPCYEWQAARKRIVDRSAYVTASGDLQVSDEHVIHLGNVLLRGQDPPEKTSLLDAHPHSGLERAFEAGKSFLSNSSEFPEKYNGRLLFYRLFDETVLPDGAWDQIREMAKEEPR